MPLTGSPVTFSCTVTAGFARKPTGGIYDTPAIPTALSNVYVNFTTGDDSRTLTQAQNPATPWKTVQKCKANLAVGRHFHLAGGDFVGYNEYIGGAVSGTATNPIVWRQWAGQAAAVMRGGNTGDGIPAIWVVGTTSHHWVVDLTIHPQSGCRAINMSGNTLNQGWRYIRLDWKGDQFIYQADDFLFYDCTDGHTTGNVATNSGDAIVLYKSTNVRYFRHTFTGKAYHAFATVGLVTGGAAFACSGILFFDCNIKNTPAGGFNVNGNGNSTSLLWNYVHDVGTILEGGSPGSRAGIFINAPDCVVAFNRVSRCHDGIKLASYTYGGVVQKCNNVRTYHNTVSRCDGKPIGLYCASGQNPNTDCIDNRIENNIFWDNQLGTLTGDPVANEGLFGYYQGIYYGIWIETFHASQDWTTGIGTNLFRNNVVHMKAGGSAGRFAVWLRDSGSAPPSFTYATAAAFAATYATSANNITTDPLLVDTLADPPDLHIGASSPAIDAGFAITDPETVSYLSTAPDCGYAERLGSD